ncbi:MAG: hypothetical protein COW84_04565, partial [Gammaproteobacteria bacterium CG22_combo_CG10-13_8_21_14_all_40_8]
MILKYLDEPTKCSSKKKGGWTRSAISLAIAACLGCISPMSFAADDDEDVLSMSLEDLLNMDVVSATRSESKLSESPVPISVIT